ncbi:MAG: hypothetical protein KAX19_00670 [Candidatus Brocadiae bacterium]|nr:hypothetical protein [Candidatus Brocadiia bacterium]
MKRCKLLAMLAVLALLLGTPGAWGLPVDDDATCDISCVVDTIMEWEADAFPAIDLGTMTGQTDVLPGSAALVLYTNGDLVISADNTAAAELSEGGGDVLYTEYSLAYDGNGVGATGGSSVAWTVHGSFLNSASSVTHIAGYGAVQVTLGARASNAAGTLADSGNYSAIQTLTASWL